MDNINWYPGHMARARRELFEQLKRVDLVIEMCDARLPFSSRNPELEKMISGKRRVLIINKADLADPAITDKWLCLFRSRGIRCCAADARKNLRADAVRLISEVTDDISSAALGRGVRRTIRATVVGVPNVGKSTYINRVSGSGALKTADKPGVTRANRWVKISPYLEILDTPGLLWPRLDRQDAARRLCYIGSVSDDVVDPEELAEYMLRDILRISRESAVQRFRLPDDLSETDVLLEKVCSGRGYLLKGGLPDTARAAAVVLDEFRAGKLGRISLESPDDIKAGDGND